MTELQNTNDTSKQRLTQEELSSALAYFTGTEKWYRHIMNKQMLYTDGVKFLADNGGEQGAYWFIDKVALEICPLLMAKKQWFGVITLSVSDDNKAVITVEEGNNHLISTYQIHYTDMQCGEWKFYLINDETDWTMLLPSEY